MINYKKAKKLSRNNLSITLSMLILFCISSILLLIVLNAGVSNTKNTEFIATMQYRDILNLYSFNQNDLYLIIITSIFWIVSLLCAIAFWTIYIFILITLWNNKEVRKMMIIGMLIWIVASYMTFVLSIRTFEEQIEKPNTEI